MHSIGEPVGRSFGTGEQIRGAGESGSRFGGAGEQIRGAGEQVWRAGEQTWKTEEKTWRAKVQTCRFSCSCSIRFRCKTGSHKIEGSEGDGKS